VINQVLMIDQQRHVNSRVFTVLLFFLFPF
jgi:hypothetical protein